MTGPVPWEMGSTFPLTIGSRVERDPFDGGKFFGSGRQALAALLTHGRRHFGWRVLHVPTYFCPEVAHDLTRVIETRRYAASPGGEAVEPTVGDNHVVLAVSYFGQPPAPVGHGATARIVDATHDPMAEWLDGIAADYVVASLRKTIPLPDGGVVWSPAGRTLPSPAAATDRQMAGLGLMTSAMWLKASYLAGLAVDKATYLTLFREGEQYFQGGRPTAMSMLSSAVLRTLPLDEWRQRRIANIATASVALRDSPGIAVLPSTFGVVLKCVSPMLRDSIRAALVSGDVYPAVLWDLQNDDVPERDKDLSRRLLHLHADHRWERPDMDQAVRLVQSVCFEFARKEVGC